MLKESSRSLSQQTKNVSKSPGLSQGKHHPRLFRELTLGTWIPSAFASKAESDLVSTKTEESHSGVTGLKGTRSV